VLAENSKVFNAMLNRGMMQTQLSQVKIEHFAEETVVSFFKYIYSSSVQDEKTITLTRLKLVPVGTSSKEYPFNSPSLL